MSARWRRTGLMLRITVTLLLNDGVAPAAQYRDAQGNTLCGGTTLAEYTGWSPYIVDHMVLGFDAKVDASGCTFGEHKPHFFASLVDGSADGRDGDGDDNDGGKESAPPIAAASFHLRMVWHGGFSMFVHHPSLRREGGAVHARKLLQHARAHWRISWIGSSGPSSGVWNDDRALSRRDSSGDVEHSGQGVEKEPFRRRWRAFGSHSLFADVYVPPDARSGLGAPPSPSPSPSPSPPATSSSALPPRYITALEARGRFRLLGSHAILRARQSGFRVYLLNEGANFTRAHAVQYGLRVHWLHVADSVRWAAVAGNTGDTRDAAWRWHSGMQGQGFASIGVDTGGAHFRRLRAYVAVLLSANDVGWNAVQEVDTKWGAKLSDGAPASSSSMLEREARVHDWIAGSGAIHNLGLTNFRVRVTAAASAAPGFVHNGAARTHRRELEHGPKWFVSWVGFEAPAFCAVGAWGAWGECAASCGKRAQRYATRRVLRPGNAFGRVCPALRRNEPCTSPKFVRGAKIKAIAGHCPVDCLVSPWGAWGTCSAPCATGTMQRSRIVLMDEGTGRAGPQFGGVACPALQQTRPCNTHPCAGKGVSQVCGSTWAQASPEKSADGWQLYSTALSGVSHAGIFVDVNTSACAFSRRGSVPVYVASVVAADKAVFSALSDHMGVRGRLHQDVISGSKKPHSARWGSGALGAVLAAMDELRISKDQDAKIAPVDTRAQPLPQALQLLVASAISRSTPRGFRLHVWQRGVAAEQTLALARQHSLRVSWLGESGQNAGIVTAPRVGWRACNEAACAKAATLGLHVLHADVDTTSSAFAPPPAAPPAYVTALHITAGGSDSGASTESHMPRPHCSHNIVRPTASGFSLYAAFERPLSARQMELEGWSVAWLALASAVTGSSSVGGTGGTRWHAGGSGSIASYTSVFRQGFVTTPVFVSTMVVAPDRKAGGVLAAEEGLGNGGAADALPLVGGGVVVNPTALGFKTYLRPLPEYQPLFGAVPDAAAAAAAAATRGQWHINYAVYLRVDCTLSAWSMWAPCDVSCGGAPRAVTQLRTRSVVRNGYGEGTACPSPTSQALFERRACGHVPCPVNCIVGHWGPWGACRSDTGARISCGGTGIKIRRRKMRQKAAYGGVMCPPLSTLLTCSGMPCAKQAPVLRPLDSSLADDLLRYKQHGALSRGTVNRTVVRAVFEIGQAAAARLRTQASLQRFKRMLQHLVLPSTAAKSQTSDLNVQFAPHSASTSRSRIHKRIDVRVFVNSAAVAATVISRLQADDVAALLVAGSVKLVAPPTIIAPLRHEEHISRQTFIHAFVSGRVTLGLAALISALMLLMRAHSQLATRATPFSRRATEEVPLSQAYHDVSHVDGGNGGGTGDSTANGIGMLPLALAAGVSSDALRRSATHSGGEDTY